METRPPHISRMAGMAVWLVGRAVSFPGHPGIDFSHESTESPPRGDQWPMWTVAASIGTSTSAVPATRLPGAGR